MNTWLNLKDKIIIVTGGASGIGLAIVDELLAQGAKVQMSDIHGGDKHQNRDNYNFWPTDISSASEVNKTVESIIQRFGRIDGLVNNAGVNFPRLLVDEKAPSGRYELNEAAFEKMVNINQKGVFLMSQAVARQMVKQRSGVITSSSSRCAISFSIRQPTSSPFSTTGTRSSPRSASSATTCGRGSSGLTRNRQLSIK